MESENLLLIFWPLSRTKVKLGPTLRFLAQTYSNSNCNREISVQRWTSWEHFRFKQLCILTTAYSPLTTFQKKKQFPLCSPPTPPSMTQHNSPAIINSQWDIFSPPSYFPMCMLHSPYKTCHCELVCPVSISPEKKPFYPPLPINLLCKVCLWYNFCAICWPPPIIKIFFLCKTLSQCIMELQELMNIDLWNHNEQYSNAHVFLT